MLKNTCIETKMNKTRKPDKNQRINFQSCFHVVSLPVCTSSRRCIQSWKYLLQREPSHTAFWDTWQVFTVCLPVCLWTDIISKRQMFFHLIQPLGYVLLLFFGLFCCRPTSKRENNNGRFSHFHVVLAHHSGHSSLNK